MKSSDANERRLARRKRARADPSPRRRAELDALRRETELDLVRQIRRLLAKPMAERTRFLRVRLPGGGSAL
jgi:hypothetical protein